MTKKNDSHMSLPNREPDCLLPYDAFWRFLPLVAFGILDALFVKIVFLHKILPGFGFFEVLRAWMPDVSALLFVLLVFMVGYAFASGWLRKFVVVLFHVVMLYLLVGYAFNLGYFLVSGEQLSAGLIKIWLYNFENANKIMASEVSVSRLLFLGVQLLAVGGSVWFQVSKFGRNRLERMGCMGRVGSLSVFLLVAVSYYASASVPKLEGAAKPLSTQIAFKLTADVIRSYSSSGSQLEEEIEVPEYLKFDEPLVFDPNSAKQRPNIVIIGFEGLNWLNSDVYRPGLGTTPFLARLAKDSMVVDYEYTVMPHTTKALVSILCGIYPYVAIKPIETEDGVLPKRCLPHILHSQGYVSAFFESALNFERRKELTQNMGFDVYMDLESMPADEFETVNYFGKEDKAAIVPSMAWVDSVKDEPFLLTYMTITPHHNYVIPQNFPYKNFGVSDRDYNNFLNTVRYTDDFVREVFEQLKKRGLMENTIFIVLGDHGEAFGEHVAREHDLVIWDEGLRSFALYYSPKYLPKGVRVQGVRSHLDLIPTIVDVLGLRPVSGNMLGISLLRPVAANRVLFHSCSLDDKCMAEHIGPIKTIYFYDERPAEVYNDFEDPYERNNLAFEPPFTKEYIQRRIQDMLFWKKAVNYQYMQLKRATEHRQISDSMPKVAHRANVDFDGYLQLVGFDANKGRKTIRAGTTLQAHFVFACTNKLVANRQRAKFFRVRFRLEHSSGQIKDELHAQDVNGGVEMSVDVKVNDYSHLFQQCRAGQYVSVISSVSVPSKWPAGTMKALVGIEDTSTGKLLSASSESDRIENDRVLLGTFEVEPLPMDEDRMRQIAEEKLKSLRSLKPFPVKTKVGAVFGDRLELYGITPVVNDLYLRNSLEFELVYHVLKAPLPKGWKFMLVLKAADRKLLYQLDVLGNAYPVDEWKDGEYLHDYLRFVVVERYFVPGKYTLWLKLLDSQDKMVPITKCPQGVLCSDADGVLFGVMRIRAGAPTGPAEKK